MLISYIAAGVGSAAVAWLVIRALIPWLRHRGVLDVPNARSSHSVPVPRGGGFGMLAGLAVGCSIAYVSGAGLPHWTILAASAGIALCGAADDLLGGIPAGVRLAIQALLALAVVWGAGSLTALPLPVLVPIPPSLGSAAAVVWLVAVTNIFNFLDGIDGFAGTQALVAGLALGFVSPQPAITGVALALAGSAAGFLIHNWHPARIFMGDAGSTTAGFLLAALPFHAAPAETPQLVFCVALFLWFFLADGVWTLSRRILRGEPFWTPHRSHLYQQLARTGLRHDTITASVMSASVVVSAFAAIAVRSANPILCWFALAAAMALFAAYVLTTRKLTTRSRGNTVNATQQTSLSAE